MHKTTFSFIAIAILLFSSFIPYENAIATKEKEKTIEVPVQIYTLHGMKEIKKKLPIKEAMKLKKMAYETKDAIALLHDKNASFMERIKANAAIDSFLHEMEKNGLLGGMSIKEVKELVTGKYMQKHKSSVEMKRLSAFAEFLQQNGWEVNAMCGMYAAGSIYNFHPWNFLPMILIYWVFHLHQIPKWILLLFPVYIIYSLVELIPHPTTIGYWVIERSPFYGHVSWLYTIGLLGEKSLHSANFIMITFGFTGIVILGVIAIGFTLFTAFKRYE